MAFVGRWIERGGQGMARVAKSIHQGLTEEVREVERILVTNYGLLSTEEKEAILVSMRTYRNGSHFMDMVSSGCIIDLHRGLCMLPLHHFLVVKMVGAAARIFPEEMSACTAEEARVRLLHSIRQSCFTLHRDILLPLLQGELDSFQVVPEIRSASLDLDPARSNINALRADRLVATLEDESGALPLSRSVALWIDEWGDRLSQARQTMIRRTTTSGGGDNNGGGGGSSSAPPPKSSVAVGDPASSRSCGCSVRCCVRWTMTAIFVLLSVLLKLGKCFVFCFLCVSRHVRRRLSSGKGHQGKDAGNGGSGKSCSSAHSSGQDLEKGGGGPASATQASDEAVGASWSVRISRLQSTKNRKTGHNASPEASEETVVAVPGKRSSGGPEDAWIGHWPDEAMQSIEDLTDRSKSDYNCFYEFIYEAQKASARRGGGASASGGEASVDAEHREQRFVFIMAREDSIFDKRYVLWPLERIDYTVTQFKNSLQDADNNIQQFSGWLQDRASSPTQFHLKSNELPRF